MIQRQSQNTLQPKHLFYCGLSMRLNLKEIIVDGTSIITDIHLSVALLIDFVLCGFGLKEITARGFISLLCY